MKSITKIIFIVLLFISIFIIIFANKTNIQEANRFRVYKNTLIKLSDTNLNSSVKAQDILLNYLLSTNNQDYKDKAFEDYRIKFFKIIRNSSISYNGVNFDDCDYFPDEKKTKELEKHFKKMGLILTSMEGCFYVEEDNNFTIQNFGKFLSPSWREYFALRVKENNRFVNDGSLIISWDELRQRIIYWEDFIKKYPRFPENNEIKAKLADYVEVYIDGPDGYNNQNGNLIPELKQSYEKFLKNNKASKFYPTIESWYLLLKKNKFVRESYSDGEKEVMNDVAYEKFKIKQPYKVYFYNKDIYNQLNP